MTGSKGNFFLFLYASAVVYALVSLYPLPGYNPLDSFSGNPPAVFWQALEGDQSLMYRSNPLRNGFSPASAIGASKMRVFVSSQNQGIHGASKASPIGSEGIIYSANDTGWLRAYRIHDASLVWDYYAPNSLRGIHATPLLLGNGICFGLYNGVFQCLNRKTGEPLWNRLIGGAVGASAAYVNGAIFVAVETTKILDGFVVKLNPKDGNLLWRSAYLGEQAHSSPAIKSGRVFVGANNGVVVALAEDSGKELWRVNVGGAVKSSPMLAEGLVFITSVSGELLALKEESGEILWRVSIGVSQSTPTLLRGGKSLILSSEQGISVHALNDGAILAKHDWIGSTLDARKPSALALHDSVWIACGHLSLCVFSADGKKLLRTYSVPGTVTGMPWLQEGKIFVSTTDAGDLLVFE